MASGCRSETRAPHLRPSTALASKMARDRDRSGILRNPTLGHRIRSRRVAGHAFPRSGVLSTNAPGFRRRLRSPGIAEPATRGAVDAHVRNGGRVAGGEGGGEAAQAAERGNQRSAAGAADGGDDGGGGGRSASAAAARQPDAGAHTDVFRDAAAAGARAARANAADAARSDATAAAMGTAAGTAGGESANASTPARVGARAGGRSAGSAARIEARAGAAEFGEAAHGGHRIGEVWSAAGLGSATRCGGAGADDRNVRRSVAPGPRAWPVAGGGCGGGL